jgi:hypothetical protein
MAPPERRVPADRNLMVMMQLKSIVRCVLIPQTSLAHRPNREQLAVQTWCGWSLSVNSVAARSQRQSHPHMHGRLKRRRVVLYESEPTIHRACGGNQSILLRSVEHNISALLQYFADRSSNVR